MKKIASVFLSVAILCSTLINVTVIAEDNTDIESLVDSLVSGYENEVIYANNFNGEKAEEFEMADGYSNGTTTIIDGQLVFKSSNVTVTKEGILNRKVKDFVYSSAITVSSGTFDIFLANEAAWARYPFLRVNVSDGVLKLSWNYESGASVAATETFVVAQKYNLVLSYIQNVVNIYFWEYGSAIPLSPTVTYTGTCSESNIYYHTYATNTKIDDVKVIEIDSEALSENDIASVTNVDIVGRLIYYNNFNDGKYPELLVNSAHSSGKLANSNKALNVISTDSFATSDGILGKNIKNYVYAFDFDFKKNTSNIDFTLNDTTGWVSNLYLRMQYSANGYYKAKIRSNTTDLAVSDQEFAYGKMHHIVITAINDTVSVYVWEQGAQKPTKATLSVERALVAGDFRYHAYKTTAVIDNIRIYDLSDSVYLSGWSAREHYCTVVDRNIELKNYSGNNFCVSNNRLHSFVLQADIEHTENSAGIIFGSKNNNYENLGNKWFGLVLTKNSVRLYNESTWNKEDGLNITKNISDMGTVKNLKIVVEGVTIKVYVDSVLQIEAIDQTYIGGYIGFLSYKTDASISNISVRNLDNKFNTNLVNFETFGGVWNETTEGYSVLNSNGSAVYSVSDSVTASNEAFSLNTVVAFSKAQGKTGVVIGLAQKNKPEENSYVISFDRTNRLLEFVNYTDGTEQELGQATISTKDTYNLRVTLKEKTLSIYVDYDMLLSVDVESFEGGYIGFMTNGADAVFNNTYVYSFDSPKLVSLSVDGVELNTEFDPTLTTYIAVVETEVDSVKINTVVGAGNTVSIANGVTGNVIENGKCSLNLGYNKIILTVQSPFSSGTTDYTLIIRRMVDPSTVYNEDGRAQLHFSPQIYNLNDPNGLIYNAYRDEYHLYYQYNPYFLGNGYRSWGHAVSKDLVNWEEKPVVLFNDENGAKWSGSAVVDKENVSGLFDSSTHPDDRMVFFVTNWLDGAKIQIAYSTDGGETLKYYNNGEFILSRQDPKVVYHKETNRWLLIPTSGEIYYSDNLINWTLGGRTYDKNGAQLMNWECQDFYPLEVDGDLNNVKWVLNAAGSWYTVGRLEYTENTYNFYSETPVQVYNGESNQWKTQSENNAYFEQRADKSLYATQSFFNDKLGRRIAISWVKEIKGVENTWQCYETLTHEQTLKSTKEGGYVLYTYPVEEVNGNRLNPIFHTEDKTVGENENILSDTKALIYDIEAEVTLSKDTTEVGFTIRDNTTNYIKVYYDVQMGKLIVDKKKSGSKYIGQYGDASMPMSVLDGNKIKFRIVVDNAVLEVFGNDGEAPIVSMAKPLNNSGMSFYVRGGNVTVNELTVYTMQSIWKEKYDIGDLNGDGVVGSKDLVSMKKHLLGLCKELIGSYDMNSDKYIDIRDLIALKKHLAKV